MSLLISDALGELKRVFGFDSFRPPQDDVVEAVLEGRDAFVLMPTGAGKSVCYQIPGIMREGTAVVVSPLISLMKDQVDALVQNGVEAAFFNSSMSDEQADGVLRKLEAGSWICFMFRQSG